MKKPQVVNVKKKSRSVFWVTLLSRLQKKCGMLTLHTAPISILWNEVMSLAPPTLAFGSGMVAQAGLPRFGNHVFKRLVLLDHGVHLAPVGQSAKVAVVYPYFGLDLTGEVVVVFLLLLRIVLVDRQSASSACRWQKESPDQSQDSDAPLWCRRNPLL